MKRKAREAGGKQGDGSSASLVSAGKQVGSRGTVLLLRHGFEARVKQGDGSHASPRFE